MILLIIEMISINSSEYQYQNFYTNTKSDAKF